MEFDGFDWDRGNRAKCQKHGVSIAEIESLFYGTFFISPDLKHSDEEDRMQAYGTNIKGRDLLVTFTLRHKNGENLVRPISARYMHKKEVAHYEEEITKIKK